MPRLQLYPLVSLVAVYMYHVSATKSSQLQYAPRVSASRTLLRTIVSVYTCRPIRRHADGYKLLVRVLVSCYMCTWCRRDFKVLVYTPRSALQVR